MAIPTPSVPSSTTTISAVELKATQNNKAFYIYSGIIAVPNSETTVISVNDVGSRDVLICLSLGSDSQQTDEFDLLIKSNGTTIFTSEIGNTGQPYATGVSEYKFILPANTSFEVTLESSSATRNWTVAGYGYYLEHL